MTVSGNLGRDPELRFTPSGKAVASFSIAVYAGKDKPADWFDVTVWNGNYDLLAENCSESLSKGDRVTVSGRIVQDRWEEADGSKRTKVKIVADDVSASMKRASLGIQRNERRTPDEDERDAYADVPPPSSEPLPTAAPGGYAYPDEEPFIRDAGEWQPGAWGLYPGEAKF